MQEVMTLLEMIARPAVAVIGGGILGWEREVHNKPAGLRTQMMVALGASVFTLVTLEFFQRLSLSDASIRVDPLRALAGNRWWLLCHSPAT